MWRIVAALALLGSSGCSNQTLPVDDAFSPEVISVYGVAPPP